ncbi:cupin domain-containing protein [Eremomyces bilateralis CBS 781.70]|uniref:Cupin domain-containing protein n=1 Tax=Eremomyces bilateralis CBS 781.70 TaxID=1392243 RepID=A0A6G1FQS6_9PEZI|nr:cupin domain-containing protein [Eremomyces bilateralis CBS 781.70]KAF1808144.1 cupin domain-containing protein [Eremomyces bilateralis CBS 781.70]
MLGLPPIRRIITGHDDNGRAVIDDDCTFHPFDPRSVLPGAKSTPQSNNAAPPVRGFIHLWRTENAPAKIQGPWTEYQNKAIPLSDATGTTVRVVDMSPGQYSPMHRTASLDVGVVLKGAVVLELDDKTETTLKEGETIIQRGTIHAWHNRTQEAARILFVLLPAEKVVVNGEELAPTIFDVN